MRDHAGGVSATGADGHPERVEHKLGFEVVAHRPADDAAAEHVLDGGEKEEALTGLDVLQVADPEPVRLRSGEVTVDEIRGRDPLRIVDRRPRLGRLPLGNLDQHVGVIEHLVAGAAEEAALGRSMFRHDSLDQAHELGPHAWFGLKLDDHLDHRFASPSSSDAIHAPPRWVSDARAYCAGTGETTFACASVREGPLGC